MAELAGFDNKTPPLARPEDLHSSNIVKGFRRHKTNAPGPGPGAL